MSAGVAHDTANCALPETTTTDVGQPGTPRGVVDAEEADGSPYPTAFLAITLITYAVPFVKPVIVRDV